MEKILTTKDVADLLQCHPQSVYRNKELSYIKIPGIGIRYKESELDKYLEQKSIKTHSLMTPLNSSNSFKLTNLDEFDKMYLQINKGGNCGSMNGKKTRWNYGIGAIYVRKTKQGKERWYIDYRDEEGKRIQKVVKKAQSREEAMLALQKAVSDVFSREHDIKPKQKKVKFQEFADLYLENYAKSNKRSWKTDEYYLKGIKEFLNNLYLDEVTPLHIEKYKAERLKQGVQPSTVNRCLAILKKMFNLAVEWGFLENNQIGKVKLFSEKDNRKERILTKEEEIRLLKASSEHLKTILIVALNAGMRLGEILSLPWSQIDLSRKTIRVEKTKSGRIRIININSNLLDELLKLKKRSGDCVHLFINPRTGKPLTTVKTAFKAACRRAGVQGLRFHDLRHTFASRLIEKGADIITVKDLLGHSSVKITERYTHSQKEQKKKAVELLEENQEEAIFEEDLLHICDTEKKGKREKLLTSLFSMN